MPMKQGDLMAHTDQYDCILITTNGIIRRDGCLVMGRGLARQVVKRHPTFPRRVAKAIQHLGTQKTKGGPYFYGVITPYQINTFRCTTSTPPGVLYKFGIFQVKTHWALPATVELILESAVQLNVLLRRNPTAKCALNYPGTGWGRLSREVVDPILKKYLLPHPNLDIWTF